MIGRIRPQLVEDEGNNKMRLIICLDDNNGMMFNNRRQSQDRKLREDIMQMIGSSRLWMSEYSAKQFLIDSHINISLEKFSEAGSDDYCFIESEISEAMLDKASEIVIYRWNRYYPADVRFNHFLEREGWTKTVIGEFKGYSHKKITKEVFSR